MGTDLLKNIFVTSTLRTVAFVRLIKTLDGTELAKFTTVKARHLNSGDYWEVILETESDSASLLKSSLEDGMLREWKMDFYFI